MTFNERIVIGVIAAGVGVGAYLVTHRKPSTPPTVPTSFTPTMGTSTAPSATQSPLALSAADAGVTPMELRNWRIRIQPEQCTQSGERLNKLDGRAPTDPKAINAVSLCFQYGNVAWVACLNDAKDYETAKTCNFRFLQPPPP